MKDGKDKISYISGNSDGGLYRRVNRAGIIVIGIIVIIVILKTV